MKILSKKLIFPYETPQTHNCEHPNPRTRKLFHFDFTSFMISFYRCHGESYKERWLTGDSTVSVCPVTYNWRKPCVCVPTWHRRCQLGSKRLRMCEEGPFPLFAALCISTKFSAKGLTYKGASNNLWEMGNSQYLLILFFCDFVEVLSYTKTSSRFLRLMSSKWLS